MKTVWAGLFFLLISVSLQAEMRYWRNVDGKRFEGEFSQELFDVYYIRTPGGAEIKIPIDKLDPVDAEFLKVSVPPKVEVKFLKSGMVKKRHDSVEPDDVIEIVTGKATIKKISKLAYVGTLTAEVFMIAKERNREVNKNDVYRLITKKRESFTFSEEKNAKYEITLTGEARSFVRDDLNDAFWGCEYFGYVVLVTDAKNNVVAIDSKLRDFNAENVADLRKVPVNSFFNERGQRVPVPRPKDSRDLSLWMAYF